MPRCAALLLLLAALAGLAAARDRGCSDDCGPWANSYCNSTANVCRCAPGARGGGSGGHLIILV
jgi:hypothetical protein